MNSIHTLFRTLRGLANAPSVVYLKKIVSHNNVCLCVVSEPRILLSRLWSLKIFPGNVNGITNQDVGGQLWVIWHNDVIVRLIHKSNQMITFEVSLNHNVFYVIAIYARYTM